jgi:hypothetical protein
MSDRKHTADTETDAAVDLPFPDAAMRAESEWLIERDRNPGAPAPSPAIAREYAEIEDLLHAMPPGLSDPSWQDDVLREAAASAAPTRRSRRRAAWLVAGGLVPAAAAAVFWLRPAAAQNLTVEFQKVAVTRSDPNEHVVGDRLTVHARSRGAGDLRIYRDGGVLVAKCPNGGAVCTATTDHYTIELTFKVPGHYEVYFAPISGAPEPKDEFINAVIEAKLQLDNSHEFAVH